MSKEPTVDEIERVAKVLYRSMEDIEPGKLQAHVDAMFNDPDPNYVRDYLNAARAAILAMDRRPSPPAAEEPRQEPVAFAEVYSGRVVSVSMTEGRHHTTPLFRS